MEYHIFVARKSNCLPIQECGGIILEPSFQLLVDDYTANKLQVNYRGLLIKAGKQEKAKLANGHYEVLGPKKEKAAPPMANISEDKSMINKSRRKVK